jgi:hypothetical protein
MTWTLDFPSPTRSPTSPATAAAALELSQNDIHEIEGAE